MSGATLNQWPVMWSGLLFWNQWLCNNFNHFGRVYSLQSTFLYFAGMNCTGVVEPYQSIYFWSLLFFFDEYPYLLLSYIQYSVVLFPHWFMHQLGIDYSITTGAWRLSLTILIERRVRKSKAPFWPSHFFRVPAVSCGSFQNWWWYPVTWIFAPLPPFLPMMWLANLGEVGANGSITIVITHTPKTTTMLNI